MKIFIITLLCFLTIADQSFATERHVAPPNPSSVVELNIYYPEAEAKEDFGLFLPVRHVVGDNVESDSYQQITGQRQPDGCFRFRFVLPSGAAGRGAYVVVAKLRNTTDTTKLLSGAGALLPYYLLDHYYVQGGDRVTMHVRKSSDFDIVRTQINNFRFRFTGRGALKYRLRYLTDSIGHSIDFVHDFFRADSGYNTGNFERHKIDRLLAFIEPYLGQLNRDDRTQLELHVIYQVRKQEALLIRSMVRNKWAGATTAARNRFIAGYISGEQGFRRDYMTADLSASYDFWYAEMERSRKIAFIQHGEGYRDSLISVITRVVPDWEQPDLILLTLHELSSGIRDLDASFLIANKLMRTAEQKSALAEMMQARPGRIADDFTLPDTAGKLVSLSDFKGKIVFIDFWYTGCGNCVKYFSDVLSRVEEEYKGDPDVVFLTISIDRVMPSWLQSLRTGQYTSAHSINLYTAGKAALHEVIRYFRVTGYPNPVIIGRDRRIVDIGTNLRSREGLLHAIQEAKSK